MKEYNHLKKWADEEFRTLKDHSDYLISSYGRIISIASKQPKVMSPFEQSQSRVYKRIKINTRNKCKSYLIHRLVAEAFIENPEHKKEVNHINGIKDDNRISNLEWVTRGENQSHAYRSGFRNHLVGNKHHRSKLTEKKVIAAKRMIENGYTIVSIAKELDAPVNALYKIKSGETWKHVKMEV